MSILGSPLARLVRRVGRGVPPIRPEAFAASDRTLYAPPTCPALLAFPGQTVRGDGTARLVSSLCTAELLASDAFRFWIATIKEEWHFHRKLWEWAYICQALYERGLLNDGKRGVAFAVGRESLPALFASYGCTIVATDLAADDPRATGWATSGEWARTLAELNRLGLCPEPLFRERVSFRPVDMNHIPADLRDFDFSWSSCSFEHCGSLELGAAFLINQMDCLRPGGVAVHTTEFNLTSNTRTVRTGRTVIYRRRDIEDIVRQLRGLGHAVELLDLTVGTHPLDWHVDERPYSVDRHLRKRQGRYATTSIGLIITKSASLL
ncbi:MAG TPA: class I SAM-dependent methyltransferase [Gemmatimonadaceae bacterium]